MSSAPAGHYILSVSDLSVHFRGLRALSSVSIDVSPDEVFGLIGPNGAGKTTLFNCISRIYEPSAGTILFDGRPLSGYKPHEIAQVGIARTFQNVALINALTVLDNVMLGGFHHGPQSFIGAALALRSTRRSDRVLRQRADSLLSKFHLNAVAHVRVSELPMVTRRRVELVRALMSAPRLLLLDEPAAGLNPTDVRALGSMIGEIRNENALAIILVEHHIGLVMDACDRVAVLNFGVKLAEGTPRAVRDDPAVIAAYLGEERE